MYKDLSMEQLKQLLSELQKQHDEYKAQGLKLNMARGKPAPDQLKLSEAMLKDDLGDCLAADGTDCRNYGVLDGIPEAKELLSHHGIIKVATKYPRIARDYFHNKKHQTVDIIKLNGSIELAPIVGLSDVICDIVETGSTLKENGLTLLEEVCPLSARMVVNQVSMRMEAERIREIIEALRGIS